MYGFRVGHIRSLRFLRRIIQTVATKSVRQLGQIQLKVQRNYLADSKICGFGAAHILRINIANNIFSFIGLDQRNSVQLRLDVPI